MELYHIGKQCATPDCHQLDFLPFNCYTCKKSYCLDHKDFQHHISCSRPTAAAPLPCPKCSHPVNGTSPYQTKEYSESMIQAHIDNGCQTPEQEAKQRKMGKKCRFGTCRRTEGVVFGCRGCGNRYCSAHRMMEDHGCTAREVGLRGMPDAPVRAVNLSHLIRVR
ncbi:hypothetical protein BJ741DRAFT_621033 [Chytriomyces cf. hyalinus JEL632]|nr:hypothetical protein BJ741DRAFT_621033 [Chytriomyces cf. hyalinus JEL632]